MSALEAYTVLALVTASVFLFFKVYEKLVLPVRLDKTTRLETVLHVSGSAPDLEATLRGLLFLHGSGRLKMVIIIVDEGMDDDTRKTAELFCKNRSCVYIESREHYANCPYGSSAKN